MQTDEAAEVVLRRLLDHLRASYTHTGRVYGDTVQIFQRYRTLRPYLVELPVSSVPSSTGAQGAQSSTTVHMIGLGGTIPILYHSNTYNIPITILLPPAYPYEAPSAFVQPTSSMELKQPHPHVNAHGRCHFTYLTGWRPQTCTVLVVVEILRKAFSEQPPVRSKASSTASSHSVLPVHAPSSPASHHPPPASSACPSPSLSPTGLLTTPTSFLPNSNPSIASTTATATAASSSFSSSSHPSSNGHVHYPHHSFPAEQKATGTTMPTTTTTTTTTTMPTTTTIPTTTTMPTTTTTGNAYDSRNTDHLISLFPSALSLNPCDRNTNTTAHTSSSTQPASSTQSSGSSSLLDLGDITWPSSTHSAHSSAASHSQPSAAHGTSASSLCSGLPAHLALASSQPLLPTKDPAVMRAERLAALRSRLYAALTERYRRAEQEVCEQEASLRQTQATLQGERRELAQSRQYHVAELDQLRMYGEELAERVSRLDAWIQEHEHKQIDVEAHCTPSRAIEQQLQNTQAEAEAIDDVLYQLFQSYHCDMISFDEWQRQTRHWARRQFLLRALERKIQTFL